MNAIMSVQLDPAIWTLIALFLTGTLIAFVVLLKAGFFKSCFAYLCHCSYPLCYPFVHRNIDREEDIEMAYRWPGAGESRHNL